MRTSVIVFVSLVLVVSSVLASGLTTELEKSLQQKPTHPAAATEGAPPPPTFSALTCAFPDNFLAFSVFKYDAATKRISRVDLNNSESICPSENSNASLSYNAYFHPIHGVTYSTDASGSVEIRTTKTRLRIHSAPALNDHGRWNKEGTMIVWTSTREENPLPNRGWTALYVAKYSSSSSTTNSLSSPTRLTPANVTDFSPAWHPSKPWIAAVSGSGAHQGGDIILIKLSPVSSDDDGGTTVSAQNRTIVTKNGGWPTWKNDHTIVFHRNTGPTLADWSLVEVDIHTGAETTLVGGGSGGDTTVAMTPHIDGDLLAYATLKDTFRQIVLMNLTTKTIKAGITVGNTHHYNPTVTAGGDVYFHACRGGVFPNMQRRASHQGIDVIYVSGDFPSVSPDGKQVSVIDANFAIFYAISTFNADGTNKQVLYNASHAWMTSWVNQSSIAFTRGPAFAWATDGSVQVAAVNTETKNTTLLTDDPSANQGYPCYSPDGEFIVYRTSSTFGFNRLKKSGDGGVTPPEFPGPYHLRVMRRAGTAHRHGKRKVRIGPEESFFKDGDVRREENGEEEGDVIEEQILTLPAFDGAMIGDTHPHWGPDFIVFTSDRGHPGQPTIWTINPDGSNLTEIFNHGAASVHPSTTPDRKRIVFSSTIAEYSMEEISWAFVFFPRSELYVMDNDGTNYHRLTHDGSTNANVFVGPHLLPPNISKTEGPTCSCSFLDSTEPEPDASPEEKHNPAAHAVVRKHGVAAKGSICPAAAEQEQEQEGGLFFKEQQAKLLLAEKKKKQKGDPTHREDTQQQDGAPRSGCPFARFLGRK